MTARRRIAAVLGVAVVGLAFAGCTPSNNTLEQRTARSAFAAFYGAPGGDDIDCRFDPVEPGSVGDRYDGTCTVQGKTLLVSALYDEYSPGVWLGYVVVQTPAGTSNPRIHACSFNKRSGEAWVRTSTCDTQAGEIPGRSAER